MPEYPADRLSPRGPLRLRDATRRAPGEGDGPRNLIEREATAARGRAAWLAVGPRAATGRSYAARRARRAGRGAHARAAGCAPRAPARPRPARPGAPRTRRSPSAAARARAGGRGEQPG